MPAFCLYVAVEALGLNNSCYAFASQNWIFSLGSWINTFYEVYVKANHNQGETIKKKIKIWLIATI